MSFVGESGSGHSVVMDGAPENGGRNLGLRPMEMVLLGLGGCTAYDVVLMLQKSRQNVIDVEVVLDAARSEEIPKVFTHIKAHFRVAGLSSMKSMCSARCRCQLTSTAPLPKCSRKLPVLTTPGKLWTRSERDGW